MAAQSVGSGGGLNQQTTASRTFYSKMLLATLHQWLGVRSFAKDSLDIPKNSGQTISWRQFSKLSAATTALTEGSPPSGSNLSISEITAVLAQYGDFIEFTDLILETGADPYALQTLQLQARQVALTFDSLIQSAILAGTNVTYASTATARNQVSSAMTFATAKLDRVIRNLQSRHVPYVTSWINPSTGVSTVTGLPAYIAFVTPQMWENIKGATGVQTVDKYQSGNTTFPNEVGKYDAIRFIMSTVGYISTGTGAAGVDVQLMPVFGQDAFGVSKLEGDAVKALVRNIDTPDSSDKLGQKGHIGWKAYFVAKLLDQNKIERYEFYAA